MYKNCEAIQTSLDSQIASKNIMTCEKKDTPTTRPTTNPNTPPPPPALPTKKSFTKYFVKCKQGFKIKIELLQMIRKFEQQIKTKFWKQKQTNTATEKNEEEDEGKPRTDILFAGEPRR